MAVPPLQALVAAGFDVALVVSRADKRRGRRAEPTPSPVKAAAVDLGIEVTASVDDALDVGADLGVVVAFGRIVKPHVLDRLAMVNLHFSLLPRWRGAAPVERALLAGDDETGVDLMAVEEGLDTGPVYARRRVPIGPDDTADDLRRTLVGEGTELLIESLSEGLTTPAPQQGEPTVAAKVERGDLELDWWRPAEELHRIVRVGGAWTTFRDRLLKVHRAALPGIAAGPAPGHLAGDVVGTGAGGLQLVEVQPEGRGRIAAADWLNGARVTAGDVLGDPVRHG